MKCFKLILGLLLTGFGIVHAGNNLHVTDSWMLYRLYLGVMMVLVGGKFIFSPNAGLSTELNPPSYPADSSHWWVFLVLVLLLPNLFLNGAWWVFHWAFVHPVPWWVGFSGTVLIGLAAAIIIVCILSTLEYLTKSKKTGTK